MPAPHTRGHGAVHSGRLQCCTLYGFGNMKTECEETVDIANAYAVIKPVIIPGEFHRENSMLSCWGIRIREKESWYVMNDTDPEADIHCRGKT